MGRLVDEQRDHQHPGKGESKQEGAGEAEEGCRLAIFKPAKSTMSMVKMGHDLAR
jgi:hypothetical protein